MKMAQGKVRNEMRRMREKVIEVIVLWLLVAELCIAGYEDNAYQRKRSDPALYGTMDENCVFWISTAKDLKWFLRYVREGHEDLDGALTCDVDLGGEVCFGNHYRGHFDGNGHTIVGGVYELILILERGGRIENLNLENVSIADDQYGCGGLVYNNYGEIVNCRVSGHVEGTGYTGGIAGSNYGLIGNCVNRADVVSTKTDAVYGYGSDSEGGAGGIAGYSGTIWDEDGLPHIPVIADCTNQGKVTAQTIAGGICAVVDDRSNEAAPNNSVQEMVEEFGYSVTQNGDPAQDEKETEAVQESEAAMQGVPPGETPEGTPGVSPCVSPGKHFSVWNCKNEGNVTVEQVVDCYGGYTKAGGICGILHWGDLYHCANLGMIRISGDAPEQSETGWIYVNRPMAITYNMGYAQSEKQHIVDCVSLKGMVTETMRHENVMELTEEELPLWEAGKLTYISNNWQFDLAQAAHDCSLEPLGVTEHTLSQKKENYYLCGSFAIKLPEGFEVTEESAGGAIYALRIRQKEMTESGGKDTGTETVRENGETEQVDFSDYEVWLLRKEADVESALQETRTSNTLPSWRTQYFIEEVFGTLPNEHILGIDSLNLPGHDCYQRKVLSGPRIYMEDGIPPMWLPVYMQEEDHVLGNLIVMPLEGNAEDGLRAKWLFVFTNRESNIRPPDDYIELVENSFYPLDGTERFLTVGDGDTLWELAKRYTGESDNWRILAEMNGMEENDRLLAGQRFLVPDKEAWAKKPTYIDPAWLTEP